MIWALALLLSATPADDPRPHLAELYLTGQTEAALIEAEARARVSAEVAGASGLHYLRGRLLEDLGRDGEAARAYAETMAATPALRLYGRYRLAKTEEERGRPEVAAGLAAQIVAAPAPEGLLTAANRLLARTVLKGGDCKVVQGLSNSSLPSVESRRLRAVKAHCTARSGDLMRAAELLEAIIARNMNDEAARIAAYQLAALPPARTASERQRRNLLLGLVFHQHREFDRSISYLTEATKAFTGRHMLRSQSEFDALYGLARGHFWQERFDVAATKFAALAPRARSLDERAQILYQQGRSLELGGDWNTARTVFRRAYSTAPTGRWADAALLSAMRIEWRGNQERDALDLYRRLRSRPAWGDLAARGALFLAASDISRGVAERADPWLADAGRLSGDYHLDVDYWRGRLAELRSNPDGAVDRYLAALLRDPYHPLSESARERLKAPPLAAIVQSLGRRLIASGRGEDLYQAFLLLGLDDPRGRQTYETLTRRMASQAETLPLSRLSTVSPRDWLLWDSQLDQPEEMLLALGLFDEGAPAVSRYFPSNNPALAFTASQLLFQAGEVRRSLRIADRVRRDIANRVAMPLVPSSLRNLIYPFAWGESIRSEAERYEIDPYLLAAIIREESAYDPEALSTVSARGLTQFVWLTARRLANENGLGQITPDDLYRPKISIHLGAAYIAELLERFNGSMPAAVASYNAGVPQAQLWQSYCYTRDPAEFYSKVGFGQTRNYLRKVLSSRAQYEELYAGDE